MIYLLIATQRHSVSLRLNLMPGLDRTTLNKIDSALAIARVRRDIRTDFILPPHFDLIFLKAADELWARTHELLSSGKYAPEPVLTVAVPKTRNFTRPGASFLQSIGLSINRWVIYPLQLSKRSWTDLDIQPCHCGIRIGRTLLRARTSLLGPLSNCTPQTR